MARSQLSTCLHRPLLELITCAAIFGLSHAATARIIYVNAEATGIHDGTSWPNAYTDLQNAVLDSGSPDCPCEIWIAQGTYKPDRGTGDRNAFFNLVGDLSLYGGFAGNENCLDERDPSDHPTILSGDLARISHQGIDKGCVLWHKVFVQSNLCQARRQPL